MRVSVSVPESVERGWRARHRWWMADAFLPLFSFGATWESSKYRPDGSAPVSSKVTRSGWEATIANFFTLRRGHIDDPVGTVVGDTWGWGMGLDVAHVAGVRYDRASVPQSKYLKERVVRNGLVVFFDPIETWKRCR